MDRKRALITGLGGFTGRYMADEMTRNGYEVFGIGHGPCPDKGYTQVDINDGAALRSLLSDLQPDVVIHLAALAFVAHGEVSDFYKVNLMGTRQLLESLVTAGCRPSSVLLASSANIYGNSHVDIINEDVVPSPANDYAVSKIAMEYMARLWSDRLPLITVRPFNYTGVGQTNNFLLPKIVDHFKKRATRIELGNLDIARDFSDVRTVVHLYRRLLETPASLNGIYNVCNGIAYSLREVIGLCEDLTRHHLDVVVNPAFVRSSDVKILRGDNTKLHALLGGWNGPSLRDTLAWMLEH